MKRLFFILLALMGMGSLVQAATPTPKVPSCETLCNALKQANSEMEKSTKTLFPLEDTACSSNKDCIAAHKALRKTISGGVQKAINDAWNNYFSARHAACKADSNCRPVYKKNVKDTQVAQQASTVYENRKCPASACQA